MAVSFFLFLSEHCEADLSFDECGVQLSGILIVFGVQSGAEDGGLAFECQESIADQ